MSIGENISKNLERHELSLKAIAKKANIPYPSILPMKSKMDYKTHVVDKLAVAMDVHVIELICSQDEIMAFMEKKSIELKKKFPGFVDKVIGG